MAKIRGPRGVGIRDPDRVRRGPCDRPQSGIEFVDRVVRVSKDKTALAGRWRGVFGPLLDKRGARLALGPRPANGSLLLIDAERVMKIALGHHLRGAALVGLVLAFDFAEHGGAIAVFERAKHPSPIDAG